MARWLMAGALAVAMLAAVVASTWDRAPRGGHAPAAGPAEGPHPGPAATAPTAQGRAGTGALVIWGRGDLTPAFAGVVAALPGVTAVAHVQSTTLGLAASRHASGAPADQVPEGFRIPVSVAAVDPVGYAATLPPDADRAALAGLAPGRVLLSATGARLRGVGVGGQVDLAGLGGLEVAGVVPDGTVGNAEIILHAADAGAAGLDEDGTVFLRHAAPPGPATETLTDRIATLVPPDVTARIVDVGAGEPRRRAPLVLSLAEVKDRFGEFAFRPRAGVREIDIDRAFPAANIVAADVPILGSVTCHRGIVDDLHGALTRIVDAGLAREIDPVRYAGCYHPRRIAASRTGLSRHSWGIALDINVDATRPGFGPPPHPGIVAAFEAHGFRWGGDFLHADNPHFEWVGEVAGGSGATGR